MRKKEERWIRRSWRLELALGGLLALTIVGLVVGLMALNRDIDAVAAAAPRNDSIGSPALQDRAVIASKLADGAVTATRGGRQRPHGCPDRRGEAREGPGRRESRPRGQGRPGGQRCQGGQGRRRLRPRGDRGRPVRPPAEPGSDRDPHEHARHQGARQREVPGGHHDRRRRSLHRRGRARRDHHERARGRPQAPGWPRPRRSALRRVRGRSWSARGCVGCGG